MSPRGAGARTLRATNLVSTSHLRLSTMSNAQAKRPRAVSGGDTAQCSCTRSSYHRTAHDSLRVRSAKRQRLIDATITLLDIVKESADAFPPLKSCLGAIDAFRKHCEVCPCRFAVISLTCSPQQSKDVEEKLRDLIPWLAALESAVATETLDINPEEVLRRQQLTRLASHLYCLVDSG